MSKQSPGCYGCFGISLESLYTHQGIFVFSGECQPPSMVIAGLLLDFHPGFTCSEKGAVEWKGKSPCLY